LNFVKIGNLEWSVEDARFRNMQNGDIIPLAKNALEWDKYCLNDMPCCCAYEFDEKNINKFGLIYNVHVVLHADTIVPEGTRLATYADWNSLIENLGSNMPKDKYSQSEVLLKLKSTKGWNGKINFTYPLTGNNESRFTAVPGGQLISDMFNGTLSIDKGQGVSWWTADLAHPHIAASDKTKFNMHGTVDIAEFVDLKKSKYKTGRYMRLVKI
jgi:uncharacterized protein (TIGR02145 family)